MHPMTYYWANSHVIRTIIISNVLEETGMIKKEDIAHHLKPYIIKSNNMAINKTTSIVCEIINPFDQGHDQIKLYNIGTGKATIESTDNLKKLSVDSIVALPVPMLYNFI